MAATITPALFAIQSAQATPTTSSPTQASATYATIAELSVTITTRGGPILVWGNCSASNDTLNAATTFGLALDGATEVAEMIISEAVTSDAFEALCFNRFSGVAAGAHTFTFRWKVSAGTTSASGTRRGLLVLEVPA